MKVQRQGRKLALAHGGRDMGCEPLCATATFLGYAADLATKDSTPITFAVRVAQLMRWVSKTEVRTHRTHTHIQGWTKVEGP